MNFLFRIMTWIGRLWTDPLKRIVLIASVWTLAILILVNSAPHYTEAAIAPKTGDAMIDLELVETTEQLRLLLGEAPSTDRVTTRLKIYQDFALIPGYGILFVACGLLLARRGGWKRSAGYLAAITGLAAAGFDVAENLAILEIVDLPIADVRQPMLETIRRPALIKWALLGTGAVAMVVGSMAVASLGSRNTAKETA